ncbi:MAG: DNA-binding protein Alba [Candidatus Bathyarchaeota archaeon]
MAKKGAKREEETTQTDNVVLIGRKPVMNYVTACITFFNSGGKQVTVKARGRAICRAVDTVELLRRAFIKDLEIKHIDIDTEELFRAEGGQKSNISTIEITVTKAKQPQEEE